MVVWGVGGEVLAVCDFASFLYFVVIFVVIFAREGDEWEQNHSEWVLRMFSQRFRNSLRIQHKAGMGLVR